MARTRDAQTALEATAGVLSVPRQGDFGAPRPATGPGVTWEIPSSTGRGMAPYPHATGPNPTRPAGTIGAQHHLTTTQAFPAADGYPHVEVTAAGAQTPVVGPSPWRLVERVHHPVLAGGAMGPAQHDQHLAIDTRVSADGTHAVRSATVTAATHVAPGRVDIRTDTIQRPVSPRTARR